MEKLSNENKKILECLINGQTNIEIGAELGYSPDTIKKRLKFLYALFNVKRRTELVAKYKDKEKI